MYFATVIRKDDLTDKGLPVYNFVGEDRMEIAKLADRRAETARREYPSRLYRVLVGEITHEVKQPEWEINLVPIKEV